MLADKLDEYKERDNIYVDNNIQEIQNLYRNKRQKKELEEGRVEDKCQAQFVLEDESLQSWLRYIQSVETSCNELGDADLSE